MALPTRLRQLDQLEAVVSSNGGLVITDSARPPVFHSSPRDCPHVQPAHFATKVLENGERNGSYFWIASLAWAQEEWPGVRLCQSDACLAIVGSAGEPPLEWALREAVGVGEVKPRRREPIGAETMMTPGWQSSQRVALGYSGEQLVLRTWPAELKAQAQAFYGSARVKFLLELTATTAWEADPLPHLAYNGSRPQDRFYFRCPLPLERYVSFWQRSENLGQVGAHPLEAIESDLWPWLCQNGLGDPDDPEQVVELGRFVERLARRRAEAHLRPSVEVTHAWDRSLENDLPRLLREVREAVEQVAEALREHLSPLS